MPDRFIRRVRLLVVVAAVVGAGAQAADSSAVLDLPGGGVLPGSFGPMAGDSGTDRDTLLWTSAEFASPLEFHLDELVGVRFDSPPAAAAAAEFRFMLRGGDLLDGALEAVDGETITVAPHGGGEAVRIERRVIEGVSRIGSSIAGRYVGPGGLGGWKHEPEGAWRAEAGHIATARPGSAVLDVAAPSRAIYDVVVSWRTRPDLRLVVAATDRPGDEGAWVELMRLPSGALEAAVIRREKDRAAIEPLAAGDAATKSLRIVMFVDQAAGRLAAYTVDRGVVAAVSEVTVPPPAREPSGRFRITLGAGDVTLESLRVVPWTAEVPELDTRTTASVADRDGRRQAGEVVAFDKATGEVVVRGAAGESRLPLADVEEIVVPGREEGAEGPRPTVRVVLASGGTVAGRLAGIDDRSVRLHVDGLDGTLALPRDEMVSLTSLVTRPTPRDLPGRAGELIAGGARLRGCLVDGRDHDAAIAWLPQGATSASPLSAATTEAVVEYVSRPGREPAGDGLVEIGGIGGMVNQDAQGFFVVTMLSEDGAAARDGRVQPGDRLLAIKPRAEAEFVPTRGQDVTTVMNLLRGRVGSPVVLRVAADGGQPRDIDLERGLIYVAGRDILDQALATHARLSTPARPEEAASFPSLAILRSGDIVPCLVAGMDGTSIRLRSPVADGGGDEPLVVRAALVQAVELDPLVPARGIEKARIDRLLMLPRSQRAVPPTHLVRLHDGDYLRGRLESLDDATLVLDVRGEVKRLPRSTIARVIWLHSDDGPDEAEVGRSAPPEGLLVQGVAEGRRVTLVAEGVVDGAIRGTSPALGPGRIDLAKIDRLLVGRAIDGEADQLPYRQWKLRSAPEPKALREAAAGK